MRGPLIHSPLTIEEIAVKPSIQLSKLDGYDEILETERQRMFREFFESDDPCVQRSAMGKVALLTAARKPDFIADYENALGLGI